MSSPSRRRQRINEVIRRAVSQMIIQDVKDPRVGFVTITGVEIYEDYTAAEIRVTVLAEDDEKEKTVKALNSMRGFFQKDLGPILRTRLTPKLIFILDDRVEKAIHLDRLIAEARAGDPDQVKASEEASQESDSLNESNESGLS